MQTLLNDPNAQGGTTAFRPEFDQNVVGTYNFPILQRWGDAINGMFAELYAIVGTSGLYAANAVAFSTTVPLDTRYLTPRQSVTSALTFVPAASAVAGGSVTVELIADGNAAHVPNSDGFPLFMPTVGVSNWVNTTGTVNQVNFCCYKDNATGALVYQCTVFQGSADFPLGIPALAPAVTALSLVHGANPVLNITVAGSGLNPAYIPAISAFSVSGSDGVQVGNGLASWNKVTVTASSIQIPLSGTVAAGDVVTLNYTPPADGALQDTNSVRMGSITAVSVTAT